MAGMMCVCGRPLTTVYSPNEIELIVFTQKEWEEITESVAKGFDIFDIEPSNQVWRCTSCDRIYFFEQNRVIKRYVREV